MRKINDYTIPESWDETTIKQQLEVDKLAKEHPEFKTLAIVAGYCNIPLDELKRLPFATTREILTHLTFISEPLPVDPIHEFGFQGETYSVINTLLNQPTEDFISITSVDGRPDALQYIIAILSRKKKEDGKLETLDDYSIDERAKQFANLPLPIAKRIESFFFGQRKNISDRLKAGSRPVQSEHSRINKLYAEYNASVKWFGTIYSLCNSDITKLPQVLKTPLEQTILWLQISSRKAALDNQVQKVIQEETDKKIKAKRR